jgi:hypothetical protein
MLPGFRFLFAAVVLSMSILVFGFGAAALLRTAHEEFANTPSWQPAPETRFAQSSPAPQLATQPVLAMLRVDDLPKDAPKEAADQPASNDTVTTDAADQPAVSAEPASPPDKVAALQPVDSALSETVKPKAPTSETPVTDSSAPQAEAAPVPADTPVIPDTKLAAIEPTPAPTSEAAPTAPAKAVAAAPEQQNAPNGSEANAISIRIATLGGPPVTIAPPATKAAGAKSDTSAAKKHQAVKKHQHARLNLRRRHSAARARLTKQTQLLDPFGLPTTPATTTTTATR